MKKAVKISIKIIACIIGVCIAFAVLVLLMKYAIMLNLGALINVFILFPIALIISCAVAVAYIKIIDKLSGGRFILR